MKTRKGCERKWVRTFKRIPHPLKVTEGAPAKHENKKRLLDEEDREDEERGNGL
jgi:hypothetical protein